MSKSQNTKNEQQKDLCITSEQLTEQYKHGNLPDDRLYYYRFKGEPEVQITTQYGLYCEEADNKKEIEVIAPVPSYEVYKDLIDGRKLLREYIKDITNENAELKEYERIVTSYNMKPIDYDIACETVNKLLDDNKRLKHDVGNLGYKIKNQRHEIDNRLKEIEKLKELLKWCRDELFEVYSNEIPHHEDAPIIKKLDEVLK